MYPAHRLSLHDLSTITSHVTQQPLATGRPPGCWRTARETPNTGGIGNRSETIAVPRSVRPCPYVSGEGRPRREQLVDEVMLLLRVCSLAGDSSGAPLSERLLGRAGGIRDVGGDCRGPRPCLE
jgi:hypothetical protein